jgi:hypothetical protein
MMTGWLNRYALTGLDNAQVFYALVFSAGFFVLMYLIAHFIDKRKKQQ